MPKSCSTVCPRPKSCDVPRALMSVAPNLCCDETKNWGTYTCVTIISQNLYWLLAFIWQQLCLCYWTTSTTLSINGGQQSHCLPSTQVTTDHVLLLQGFHSSHLINICIRKERLGFPWWLSGKIPPASAGNIGSIPGLGRSHMPQGNWAWAPQLLNLCSRAR